MPRRAIASPFSLCLETTALLPEDLAVYAIVDVYLAHTLVAVEISWEFVLRTPYPYSVSNRDAQTSNVLAMSLAL